MVLNPRLPITAVVQMLTSVIAYFEIASRKMNSTTQNWKIVPLSTHAICMATGATKISLIGILEWVDFYSKRIWNGMKCLEMIIQIIGSATLKLRRMMRSIFLCHWFLTAVLSYTAVQPQMTSQNMLALIIVQSVRLNFRTFAIEYHSIILPSSPKRLGSASMASGNMVERFILSHTSTQTRHSVCQRRSWNHIQARNVVVDYTSQHIQNIERSKTNFRSCSK